MNKAKQLLKENQNLNKLNFSSVKNKNSVKIYKNNTFEHNLACFLTGHYLIMQGHKIVSEAIFKDGSRCDIYSYSHNRCFEIVMSEKKESIELKKSKYPGEITVVNAKDLLKLETSEYYKILD